jgi:hypothetical protein
MTLRSYPLLASLRFPLLLSAIVMIALPAAAQIGAPLTEQNLRSGAPKAPVQAKTEAPPPAAVPGARARPDSVAPADRAAADLPPTEALFDAINRGDIVTARDAVSRGADLDGTNLLGLTPLELSVDLGRNDISFLLLSLRGTGAGSASSRPPPGAETSGAPPTAAERRKAAAEARQQALAQARANRAQTASAAPVQKGPVLFAGDGGTPVPSAGFLGFDRH